MTSTQTVRITVSGELSDHFGAAFEGMTLVRRAGSTELVGRVVDQAQLHGLLTRIRDLGLDLESLSVAPESRTSPQTASRTPRGGRS
jgi:hypothetical protein